MSERRRRAIRVAAGLLAIWAGGVLSIAASGCGGSSGHSATSTNSSQTTSSVTHRVTTAARAKPVRLHFARILGHLPSGRSGIAAAAYGDGIVVSGGLSDAGVSTDTVFRVAPSGDASTAASLPRPAHDAASAEIGGRLLQFGGGEFEGSNRIVRVAPGRPAEIGTLPQALSDLVAVTIGGLAYVAGGWNGSDTSRDVYAVHPNGTVRTAGSFPIGVRYPAAAALDGRLILAGGELASGTPTSRAYAFDPGTRRVARLPNLPFAVDHTSGAVLDGRFYLIGGLRAAAYSDAILSWAPGERAWVAAGHLPHPLADTGAVPFDGGIAVIAGRNSAGKVRNVTLMKP